MNELDDHDRPPQAYPHPRNPDPGYITHDTSSEYDTGAPPKKFLTAWLYSNFLGIFGADRFYLGYTRLGILKLLTVGGLGVWAFADLILILTGKMRSSDGQRLEGSDHAHSLRILLLSLNAIVLISLVAQFFLFDVPNRQATEHATRQLRQDATTTDDVVSTEMAKFDFANKIGSDDQPLKCESVRLFDDDGKGRDANRCTRHLAVTYGVAVPPDEAGLKAITSQFHQNGWQHYPYESETVNDAIAEIVSTYESTGLLDYHDVRYKKSQLTAYFKLATSNLGQPQNQNFCDEFCEKIHANKSEYRYFFQVIIGYESTE